MLQTAEVRNSLKINSFYKKKEQAVFLSLILSSVVGNESRSTNSVWFLVRTSATLSTPWRSPTTGRLSFSR